jgi:hypothetical protein
VGTPLTVGPLLPEIPHSWACFLEHLLKDTLRYYQMLENSLQGRGVSPADRPLLKLFPCGRVQTKSFLYIAELRMQTDETESILDAVKLRMQRRENFLCIDE